MHRSDVISIPRPTSRSGRQRAVARIVAVCDEFLSVETDGRRVAGDDLVARHRSLKTRISRLRTRTTAPRENIITKIALMQLVTHDCVGIFNSELRFICESKDDLQTGRYLLASGGQIMDRRSRDWTFLRMFCVLAVGLMGLHYYAAPSDRRARFGIMITKWRVLYLNVTSRYDHRPFSNNVYQHIGLLSAYCYAVLFQLPRFETTLVTFAREMLRCLSSVLLFLIVRRTQNSKRC